jgi:hypothetical protein
LFDALESCRAICLYTDGVAFAAHLRDDLPRDAVKRRLGILVLDQGTAGARRTREPSGTSGRPCRAVGVEAVSGTARLMRLAGHALGSEELGPQRGRVLDWESQILPVSFQVAVCRMKLIDASIESGSEMDRIHRLQFPTAFNRSPQQRSSFPSNDLVVLNELYCRAVVPKSFNLSFDVRIKRPAVLLRLCEGNFSDRKR